MKNKTNLEFFRNRIDLRTEWGKIAWQTVMDYNQRKSPKLGLLKALVAYFPDRQLVEIMNIRPVDYQTDVKAKCICGKGLSKEMYRIGLRGHATGESPAYQINEKIRAKEPYKKRVEEFILGSECYKHLPDLLYDFGYHELRRQIGEKKKRNAKTVGEIISGFSKETKKLLSKKGINAEQLAQLSLLTKNLDLDGLESRLLYDLDPGKKNSFMNWFREGIKNDITDARIKKIYKMLENAPQFLEDKELAMLVAYQYEYRKFDSKAVLGNIKEDLLYLDKLAEDNETIKRYGKPNLDKHYVRPATIFRKRENLEERTVREKLNEEYLTFVEALGIKTHFPEIEETRVSVNRELANKYGIGRTWDYLLQKLGDVFFETKKEIASEYKKFGEIVKDKVLTKKEYMLLKDFFKRASIMENERESYLKFYSISRFEQIAPGITSIGRKVKLAEQLENPGILKKNFYLKEDLNLPKFNVNETFDNLLDIIQNTYTNNKNLLKFREKEMLSVMMMQDNGLIEKNNLLRLVRWHNYLNIPSKPTQPDEKMRQKMDYIASLAAKGLVEINPCMQRFISSKYIQQGKDYEKKFSYVSSGLHRLNKENIEERDYRKDVEAAKGLDGKGFMKLKVFGKKGYIDIKTKYYRHKAWEKEFTMSTYTPSEINGLSEKAKDYVSLKKEDLDKIDSLLKEERIVFHDPYRDCKYNSSYIYSGIIYDMRRQVAEAERRASYETEKSFGEIIIHKKDYEKLKKL
jgi:hypothetical protein